MKRFLIESHEAASRLEYREGGYSWFDGRILDANGFLVYSEVFTFLKTLPEIAEAGNAIIVAEGGMGKTFVLDEFQKSLPGDEIAKIDLAFYSNNSQRLEQEIKSAKDKKYLLIDGVDEAVDQCPTLLGTLMRVKPSAHVIIASRSIPQLKALCDCLKWPCFSLLPYTEKDVRELCEADGKDYSIFIREVEGHGLGGVCAKPLGCKMLLSSFDGSRLTATDSETLWRNALMRLCKENTYSHTRYLMKDPGVPERECWDLSTRIALILKLSGQTIVRRISPLVESTDETLDFSEFIPEDCYAKFNECLLRQLFSPIDHDKFRFSHFSYFDFMAAMGIIEYVDVSEWMKIVLSQDGVPFPQWEGAIPWLAARDDALQERVKAKRPDLLLGSDAVVAKIGAGEICKKILENADSIPTTVRENPAVQSRYYALATDDCIQPLENVLKNGGSVATVDTAIDIVRRARLQPMVDALVDFFCDDSNDISLRVNAGYALRDLANKDQLKKCRAVLSSLMPQRVKGIALRLLWPDCMTAKELVPLLTPGEDFVLDAYECWLEYEFLPSLKELHEEDTRELLSWAISNVECDDVGKEHFYEAKRGVFLHFWAKHFAQGNFELLAKGLEAYAKIYRSPFKAHSTINNKKEGYGIKDYIADVTRRREMARYIVENESFSLAPLTDFDISLLQKSDIDFIVDAIKASKVPDHRKRWAKCLENLAGWIELPKCNELWNWLHKEFPEYFVRDAEKEMEERARSYDKWNAIKQENEDRVLMQEQNRDKNNARNTKWIHETLKNGDSSKLFVHVMGVLYSQTPKGESGFGLDFRKSALWHTFSEQEFVAMIDAAYNFIIEYNGPWSEGNRYNLLLCQAFYLLMYKDKERLGALPPEAWRKFAPELLQALNYETFDLVSLTLKYFAEHQSVVFFDELAKKFKKQLADSKNIDLYQFKDIIDADILLRLLEYLDNNNLDDEQRKGLYDAFWRIDASKTSDFINGKWPLDLSIRECGIHTSAFLIASSTQNRIPELLRHLRDNPQWGRDWVLTVIGQDDYRACSISGILKLLSVFELRDLYGWLVDNFPPEKEPHHVGCYSPGPMDMVYHFISRVFSELTSRVDNNLPEVLEDLMKQFPNMSYIKDCILQARRRLVEYECFPHDVETIKQLLAKKKDGVLVNTPDDLLAVVCATLEKYQIYLRGKNNPQIRALWNEHKDCVSHKDEAALSDNMKAYMNFVLPSIVVNREVQLNTGLDGKSGSRTDLWITAISRNDKKQIELCIEVKGSWNRECKTSFNDQLCEKYMGAGGADAGIYLVGWFSSTRAKDNRNQWKDIDDARQYLKEQEISLREQGYNVRSVVIDCTY